MSALYRVRVRYYSNQGRGNTQWGHEDVAYCGEDVNEARRVYHLNHPTDVDAPPGHNGSVTTFEKMDTENLADDETGEFRDVSP